MTMAIIEEMKRRHDDNEDSMLQTAVHRLEDAFLEWQKEELLECDFLFITYWKNGCMNAYRNSYLKPKEIEIVSNIWTISMQKKFEQKLGERLQERGFLVLDKFRPAGSFKRHFSIAVKLS